MQILNLPGLTTCTIEDTHSGGSVTGLTTPIFSLLPSFHLFRPFQRIGADLFEFSRFPKLAWLSSHRSHVKPVIHSARRVPATLRPRIRTELDRMETERTTPPSPNSQPAISENCSRSIQNIHVDAQLYSGPRQGSLYKCPQHEAYSLGPRSSNMIFNKNIYRTRQCSRLIALFK